MAKEVMQLEHAIGYSGSHACAQMIPHSNKYVYVAGGCVVISDVSDFHDQTFLRGHDEDVTTMKVSESGKYLITGQRGRNADVCLWNLEEQRIVLRMTDHEKGISAVDISHDDKLMVSVGEDRRLIVWDTSNGGIVVHTSIAAAVGLQDSVREVSFGGSVEDVKRRATNNYHLTVVVSSAILAYHVDPYSASLTPLRLQMAQFQRRYTTAKYSANGDLLFVGGDTGDIAVVSTNNGTVASSVKVCNSGVREIIVDVEGKRSDAMAVTQGQGFQYARFGPSATRRSTLYVGGGDGSVLECVVADHNDPFLEVTAKTVVDAAANALSLVQPGAERVVPLIVGTAKGSLYLVSLSAQRQDASPVQRISDSATVPYDIIASHPAATDRFFTASRDGILRMWDLSTYHVVNRFQGVLKDDEAKVYCTAVCPIASMDIIISSWSDSTVRCHDMQAFELLWKHCNAHRSPITALTVAPNLKFFVTGSKEGEIKVWETRTRELLCELKEHKQEVVHLELLSDLVHLVSASRDRTIITWDTQKARRVACLEARVGGVTTLARDPTNDTTMVSAGTDHLLTQWDLRQTQSVRHTNYNNEVADSYCTRLRWSPNGSYLATGGTDQVVRLWDAATLSPVAFGYGHSGTITDVAFAPDSKQVLTCGTDACALVWNVYGSQ